MAANDLALRGDMKNGIFQHKNAKTAHEICILWSSQPNFGLI